MFMAVDRKARIDMDKNLLVVTALDGYTRNHGITMS